MTVYLYCLTDPGLEPPTELRGLGGAPVRAIAAGSAAAWASELPEGIGAATPEMARAHDAVVRAALAIETPLPARFGQTFVSEDSLRRSLDTRSAGIVRALDRVRGAVEMTVRILIPEAGEGGGTPVRHPVARPVAAAGGGEGQDDGAMEGGPRAGAGRAYLDWLLERQRSAAEADRRAGFLQARVAHEVRAIVREEARSARPRAATSLALFHLVARNDVARYRLAVYTIARREPQLRLMLSGPWAPYSFAGIVYG